MLTYCTRCIQSDSRPGLTIFSDGICSACHAFDDRKLTDWNARAHEWQELVAHVKSLDVPYHCLLPTSGGKDSHAQAVKVLDAGLRPLAFRWRPPLGTPLGEANFDNYRKLGIECLEFSINPKVEKKLMLKALRENGSQGQMHTSIFHSVSYYAWLLQIPLVVWGEDSGTEYIGKGSEFYGSRELTVDWFQKIGSTHGRDQESWADDNIPIEELTGYRCPTQDQLARTKVFQTFLWQYFPFDPAENVRVAKAYGFRGKQPGEKPLVGWYPDADLDDLAVVPHHAYGKALKFGLTREQDNLSLEIRHGRMGRDEAIRALAAAGHNVNFYAVQQFCFFTGITLEEYKEIWRGFRNHDIWKKTTEGFTLPDFIVPDFIVPDFQWNLYLEE